MLCNHPLHACAGRVVANTRPQQLGVRDLSNTQNSCSQVAALPKRSVSTLLVVIRAGSTGEGAQGALVQ